MCYIEVIVKDHVMNLRILSMKPKAFFDLLIQAAQFYNLNFLRLFAPHPS